MTTIALFWNSELRFGRQLGQGTYCTVLQVKDILLSDQPEIPSFHKTDSEPSAVLASRQRLTQKFALHRHKKVDRHAAIYGKATGPPKEIDDPEQEAAPKLASKQIRKTDLTPDVLRIAKDDFQRELEILVAISSHPNIVDLRGIGFDDVSKEPSCLLLGQIRSTLTNRLLKWRDDNGIGLYEALAWDLPNRKNLWVERLVVLSRLAHAVQHMHSHCILFRDLKPDNVGFDAVMDIPKLFDFGLAKRLKEVGDDSNNGLFHLTPETGTLRYMSVEVGTEKPYGWTADVYSLSILIHEVLSLKVPFGGIRPTQFCEVVWIAGERPALPPSWPSFIKNLLPRMWDPKPLERPSMEEVTKLLDKMLRGSDDELFPTNLVAPRSPFSMFSR